MALLLKDTFKIDTPDGSQISFSDITGEYSTPNKGGYGSPNTEYSDVQATRIKIGYKTSIEGATNPVDFFTQYKEYLCVSAPSTTIDGKTFSVGNFFVPQITGIVVDTPTDWIETGYFVYPFGYLPSVLNPVQYIGLSVIGQSNATVADDIYLIDYEVYVNPDVVGGAAVIGETYFVKGSSSDTITYEDGNSIVQTYRGGEIFTATSVENINPDSGSPEVYKLSASLSSVAILTYNLESFILNLYETCDCNELFKIVARLNALKQAAFTGNVSMTDSYNVLIDLTNRASQLSNNCNN